jgi:hypothetical protein
MQQWEYKKIDLNDVPRKTGDIDLLNDAGEDGWEFVALTPNNIAFLKRQLEEPAAAPKSPLRKSVTPTNP